MWAAQRAGMHAMQPSEVATVTRRNEQMGAARKAKSDLRNFCSLFEQGDRELAQLIGRLRRNDLSRNGQKRKHELMRHQRERRPPTRTR